MHYASEILSSAKQRTFGPSSSEPPTSSCRKSSIWSSRSAKCLLLGGLAASYGYSLGGLESVAGKTAGVARLSGDLLMSNVDLESAGVTSRFHEYGLDRDVDAATHMSSCIQRIIAGGVGSLLVQNPLPLMVGLGECLPKVSAQQKIAGEFQVNIDINGSQFHPSATSLSNDNFVVTWESRYQGGSRYGIYGQLFYGNGTKLGSEFQVNTYTSYQQYPSVASFSNGNFVATWQSGGQDGSGLGVYGQLFYDNGTKLGSEFQVNTYTASDQRDPSVTTFGNDNFVVTWSSYDQDGSIYGVYGQLFYGNASRIGNEFQVNTYTDSTQSYPSAASLSNGNFVVTWLSGIQDGSIYGVYGQLFYRNSTKIGNEFQVNTYTTNGQLDPSVASFSNGNFVVTWQSDGQDGSNYGVYGQLFDGNGTRIGNEFLVNTYTTNDQRHPSVASLSNGNFVVTWHSGGQDGSDSGVYGQLFDGNAAKFGSEFQVNTYINNSQATSSVTSFANGNFVVTWHGEGQGDNDGIYGQLFEDTLIASTTTSSTTTASSSTNNRPTSSSVTTAISPSSNPSSASNQPNISRMLSGSSSNLISTTTGQLISSNRTNTPGNSSAVWISLSIIGGIICICLGGGAVYILRKHKAIEDNSNANSSSELSGKDYSPYANIPNDRSDHKGNYANVPEDQLNGGKHNYANVSYHENDEYPKGYANVPSVVDN